MKNKSFDITLQHTTNRGAQQDPAKPKSAAPDRIKGWKPQSCGLTRREIRQVVIDQIG